MPTNKGINRDIFRAVMAKESLHHFSAMLLSNTSPKEFPSFLPLPEHSFPFPGWVEALRVQQCFQKSPGFGLTPTPSTSAGAELGQHHELL